MTIALPIKQRSVFRTRWLLRILSALSLFAATAAALAQAGISVTGTVEGRVFNPDIGEYVERARITVEGTRLETFSDANGSYRLTNVPAGTARVTAFRSGAPAQIVTLTVAGGAALQQDFTLAARPDSPGVVQLDQMVVETSREMSGAAIAINTQRFAPNIMNVVAADEFGSVASGNVGEVLKTVPGVTIAPGGLGAPYTISLNGVPPAYVPVTIGGFDIADPASGTGRTAGVHQLSINNTARIEVNYTPTPETSGSALAGSINLVPRSALERSKPTYTLSAAMLMRDRERSFARTAGPRRESTRKITPELNFSAVVPLTPRIGFTLSGTHFSTYAPYPLIQTTWRGVGAATNGGTLPDTTPANPYLSDFGVRDRVAFIRRTNGAATVDFKLSPNDRISLSIQHGVFRSPQENHTLTYNVNRVAPGDFGPTFTRGFAGAGEIRLNHLQNAQDDAHWMPAINYWHNGPVWKAEAGVGVSSSIRWTEDIQHSAFGTGVARRQNVTVSFADIREEGPRSIIVLDGTTGRPVDPYNLDSYSIVSAGSNTARRHALQRKAFGNLRREFLGPVPFTAKAGFDFSESMRDVRGYNPNFTFVGADGRAGTADDAAAIVRHEALSQRPGPYGTPRFDRFSSDELFDLYRAQPNYFQVAETAVHTGSVALSKHAEELISAGYVRGDLHLLQGRLKFVGGLRAEQTNVRGEGQLVDQTLNYRREVSGRFQLDGAGRPVLIAPAGSLDAIRLTNVDRGLRAEKEYLRWFPSLNASFNLRDNLIARAGYYHSVGRPDLVQYAGSLTLPDTQVPPGPTSRITVNNAGIKAWSARTYKATLEYYFTDVGLLSVAGFMREIENFFGATVLGATPEFLGLYGLEPAVYGAYDVLTQRNLPGKVRMSGVDLNYKQVLSVLPPWARGMQVFANASAQRATGEAADNFTGYIPRTANWGLSLTRPKYTLRVKWNYSSRARRGLVAAGRSIDPGTYNWSRERLLTDFSGEYQLTRRTALYFNLSNFFDEPADVEVAGPNTPGYARLSQRLTTGSLWTFGIRSTF